MKERKLANYVLNSTRQRIIQVILFQKKVSTNDISKELEDIPQATLYRNVKSLLDNGFIEVVEEKTIRGVIEKYYSVVKNKIFSDNPTNKEINDIIQGLIYESGRVFKDYLSNPQNDAVKDMLGFWSSTLVLSNEEYSLFLTELNDLFKKYMGREKTSERIIRNIIVMSLPRKGE